MRTSTQRKITYRRPASFRNHPLYFQRFKTARPLCGRVERSDGGTIIRGFSLIELIVVLVLMAVIASLATLSVRGVIARQRLGRAVEVIEQFDTALRRSARDQRRQVAGVIDRARARMTVDPSGDPSRTYTLPRQVSIDAIRFGPVQRSAAGAQVIANADGSSPSYALRLASGDTRRWIFLVGGSGQVVDDFNDTAVELALGMR
ncbi:type II secretion system GspH family protein [Stieleria sp. ICT_E10.1]|nr:type II secretion system GspH family protein [Stieleria sedimenti]